MIGPTPPVPVGVEPPRIGARGGFPQKSYREPNAPIGRAAGLVALAASAVASACPAAGKAPWKQRVELRCGPAYACRDATGRLSGHRSRRLESAVWLAITIVIASQSNLGRPVPQRPNRCASCCFAVICRPRTGSPGRVGPTAAPLRSREPPGVAVRRSVPRRVDRPHPPSKRASHCSRRGHRTTSRPLPGGPGRPRLARSPLAHGPASRGAPSRRRVPDRFHYRHPGPGKNAVAGKIHARGVFAAHSRSMPSPPPAAGVAGTRTVGAPRRGAPDTLGKECARTVPCAGSVQCATRAAPLRCGGGPDVADHDALHAVGVARERTLAETGSFSRRAGASRPGADQTADVTSLPDHTTGSCSQRPVACSLPIKVRRPSRHSSRSSTSSSRRRATSPTRFRCASDTRPLPVTPRRSTLPPGARGTGLRAPRPAPFAASPSRTPVAWRSRRRHP